MFSFPITSPETTMSTRRLSLRPAAVLLSATGSAFPKPSATTLLIAGCRGRPFGRSGGLRFRQGQGSASGHPQGNRVGEEESDEGEPDTDQHCPPRARTLRFGQGAAEEIGRAS